MLIFNYTLAYEQPVSILIYASLRVTWKYVYGSLKEMVCWMFLIHLTEP